VSVEAPRRQRHFARMRLLLAALCALVTLSLRATTAEACACCDGTTEREPLAWSPAGDRLLVRAEVYRGCQRTVALEVWPAGAAAPAHCYDLLANPDAAVACDALQADPTRPPGASQQVASFSVPVTSIPPASLRVSYARLQTEPIVRVRLDVALATAGFAALGSYEVFEYFYASEAGDDPGGYIPLEVAVLPAPKGQRAALLLSGDNSEPGIGHRAATLHWIDLPGAPASIAGLAKATATLVSPPDGEPAADAPLDAPRSEPPAPAVPAPPPVTVETLPKNRAAGCGCATVPAGNAPTLALLGVGLLALRRRRR
jgi:MYXO-CTERM domain-containing protein